MKKIILGTLTAIAISTGFASNNQPTVTIQFENHATYQWQILNYRSGDNRFVTEPSNISSGPVIIVLNPNSNRYASFDLIPSDDPVSYCGPADLKCCTLSYVWNPQDQEIEWMISGNRCDETDNGNARNLQMVMHLFDQKGK